MSGRGGTKDGGLPGRRAGTSVRVRAKGSRSESSRRWLERQLNDPWVEEAKRRGYSSRAAFKLLQLDDKFRLLRRGARVVDLGCAPGGWLQAAVERCGPGRVVGVDLLEVEPVAGAEAIVADFLDPAVDARLLALLDGPPDLVLSDMAAPTTGHTSTDQLRTAGLAEAALDFALKALAPGGGFVAKTFQGGIEKALLDQLRRGFAHVRHAKPAASRPESSELYVVASGFRGG